MGLLTGVLMLPIAPLKGVVWIGRQVLTVAEAELDQREQVSRELSMLREDMEQGRITPEMYSAAETALRNSPVPAEKQFPQGGDTWQADERR